MPDLSIYVFGQTALHVSLSVFLLSVSYRAAIAVAERILLASTLEYEIIPAAVLTT